MSCEWIRIDMTPYNISMYIQVIYDIYDMIYVYMTYVLMMSMYDMHSDVIGIRSLEERLRCAPASCSAAQLGGHLHPPHWPALE